MIINSSFEQKYGMPPISVVHTPGRVNLIGEHIDYNGGMVLPAALPLGVDVALSPRIDAKVHVWSDSFDEVIEADLDRSARFHWADYAIGAVRYARQHGLLKAGADLAIQSNLPAGAGLSSSSALTVGILKAAREVEKSDMSDKDIAIIARQIENEYIGVPCGIMDQMAVAIAGPGEALALNTKTLDYETVPLPERHRFAVIHSGVYRSLTDGNYAARKEECDEAKRILGIEDLCLLEKERFRDADELLDKTLYRRVRHCIGDHYRTLDAIDALKSKDIYRMGMLMRESHKSMRDDFQMSTPEIDALVESLVAQGALGARLTGGGFGGCVVALIRNEIGDSIIDHTLSRHQNAFEVC